MSTALEQLAELVKRAELKTRAQKVCEEARQAAERLKSAEERMQLADRRLTEERGPRQRDLAKAETDESLLKELTRRLAQSFATLNPEQQRAAEQYIASAQQEISELRKVAQSTLDHAFKEAQAARLELRLAQEQYQTLRKDLEQVVPDLTGEYTAVDRLARDVEKFFPGGQIQGLAREVEDGERHYGMLEPREQFAQLRIWIGRFRRLQAMVEAGSFEISEESQTQLKEVFPRLVGISKQYMPGYIEAFSRSFETDWDAYVSEAAEQLRQVTELVRRDREAEQRRRDATAREQDRLRQARESGQSVLEEIRACLASANPQEHDAEALQTLVIKAVGHLGMSDPELLELLRPHAELLTGGELRNLRRNLEQVEPEAARQRELAAFREQNQDLLDATRSLRALLVGGDVREEKRKSLQELFEFGELEWVSHESARPAMLKSLEQRIRNRGVDLLLILKDYVSHNVTDALRPVCEESGLPCLLVERGYGSAQIAEAIRRGRGRLPGGRDADAANPPAASVTANGRGGVASS